MSDFIIDTTNGLMRQENACRDPYDHLGPIEWVDKQLEFAERENFVSRSEEHTSELQSH